MYKKQVQSALNALRDGLVRLGATPYRIDLPRPAGMSKVGADDFIVMHGKKAKQKFEELERIPLLMPDAITGAALLKKKLPPKRWVIEGFLAEGFTLLAGKPKVGKSFLILQIVTALAAGGKILKDYYSNPCETVYLALEDTPLRLKTRLEKMKKAGVDINDRSKFFYKWNRVEEGGLIAIERFLEQNPKCRAIFIDTLAKVRSLPTGNNTYYEDYAAISTLKEIADKFGVAIVVVHHLRKQASDDPFDLISGSTGISGSADTNMVLIRDRGTDDAVLHITGRDVAECELAMKFDDGIWEVIGDATVVYATRIRQEILAALKEADAPLGPTEIAREIGKPPGSLPKTLKRMVQDGLIQRHEGGKYSSAQKPPKPEKEKRYTR